MSIHRRDPGACPVCGAAHTACTAGEHNAAIAVAQLPARDRAPGSPSVIAIAPPPAAAPEPTTFSTKTYDRSKHGPPGRRPR